MRIAYIAHNAVLIDGNKAYVAGTRSAGEAWRDWGKIGTWNTKHVERYGQLTEALKDNPQVDTLIGHSLGASTVAELQRQTNNKYMARYYGAPFLNLNPFDKPDLRNQTFRHPGDPVSMFDNKANNIQSNDFIYLDPPYAPEKKNSFVAYNLNGFNLQNHSNLFNIIHSFNNKFILSNADVSLVRDNFNNPKYFINSILCKRAINSKNPNAKTKEVIIKNF